MVRARHVEVSNCSSLRVVVLPNSLAHIGDNAFSHCASLTSVALPGSVTFVGNR